MFGIRFSSSNHSPRSMSRQRSEQNGFHGASQATLLTVGHSQRSSNVQHCSPNGASSIAGLSSGGVTVKANGKAVFASTDLGKHGAFASIPTRTNYRLIGSSVFWNSPLFATSCVAVALLRTNDRHNSTASCELNPLNQRVRSAQRCVPSRCSQ